MNGGGDILASGRAKSATFGPANVTQEKWDAIWSDEKSENKIEDRDGYSYLNLSHVKIKE